MTTQIVEYNITNPRLAELAEQYSIVPDATTPEGYEAIKGALAEIRPLRTGVEKKRKELKADALEWGRKVDAEARRITSRLVEIETPYKDAKQAVDMAGERKQEELRRKEQERIDGITRRIQVINGLADGLLGADAGAIEERLNRAKAILHEANEEIYGEFLEQALQAQGNVSVTLAMAYAERIEFERQRDEAASIKADQDARQAELDTQAADQAKREQEAKEKFNAEQADIRRQQEEIDRKKRVEEEERKAKLREEADRLRMENERLAREKQEAEEAEQAREAAEIETARQHDLRPEKDRLIDWLNKLRFIDGIDLDDPKLRKIQAGVLASLDRLARDNVKRVEQI